MTRLQSKSESPDPGHNGNGKGASANGNGQGNGHAARATRSGQANGVTAAEVRRRASTRKADQALVDRCRSGDAEAWQEIHVKCHAHLIRQIRYTLGDRARDGNLVEEIAARVWYGLIADNGYLLDRFQPEKGNGLEKYLAAVARFEVLRHQRGEIRRRRREQETQAARSTARDDRRFAEMTLDFQDFLPQLTPREREFFHQVLVGNSGDDLEISAPNAWQLRHRIRRKLLVFLGME